MFDVAIVGGGPAGLSAALVLGRCRRRVLVCDGDEPRNAPSHALHGFLSRDGIDPRELRDIARGDLEAYPGVELRSAVVTDVVRHEGTFRLTVGRGEHATTVDARRLLLATGMVDRLPEVPGVAERFGSTVLHCPYCDGWERRDQRLAVYGRGAETAGFALELTLWSRDVVVCTDGSDPFRRTVLERLVRNGITVEPTPVERVEGDDRLTVVFAGGARLERDAMFVAPQPRQHSPLPAMLGCRFDDHGAVATNDYEATNVPGVYVAGDASKGPQLAIVAAAEGSRAAYAINTGLLRDDLA